MNVQEVMILRTVSIRFGVALTRLELIMHKKFKQIIDNSYTLVVRCEPSGECRLTSVGESKGNVWRTGSKGRCETTLGAWPA